MKHENVIRLKVSLDEIRQRKAIIAEAKDFLGTPFHHEARVKHEGIDCGLLLLQVFENCGLICHEIPPHYPQDFMLHRDAEWYLAIIARYADEITEDPLPGDVVIFKFGRVYSHGGIIVDWPTIIHASAPDRCVLYGDVTQNPLQGRPYKMFRYRFKT